MPNITKKGAPFGSAFRALTMLNDYCLVQVMVQVSVEDPAVTV